MKQETIGSKGTVPGFRPLIGAERWHKDTFTTEMLGDSRPLLYGEKRQAGDKFLKDGRWLTVDTSMRLAEMIQSDHMGFSHHRTKRPLPPPAVETFEAHSHIWYKHTPGDECPVEPDVVVVVIFGSLNKSAYQLGKYAGSSDWGTLSSKNIEIIGYRFPDYPAVHTTLQQEQQSVQQPDQLKQQLTSIYNGWVHLPPETVAECIADVASVLYPTDAERCEAAFQRWFSLANFGGIDKTSSKIIWKDAWKAAKESK